MIVVMPSIAPSDNQTELQLKATIMSTAMPRVDAGEHGGKTTPSLLAIKAEEHQNEYSDAQIGGRNKYPGIELRLLIYFVADQVREECLKLSGEAEKEDAELEVLLSATIKSPHTDSDGGDDEEDGVPDEATSLIFCLLHRERVGGSWSRRPGVGRCSMRWNVRRGIPQAIRCDNGPELTNRHFLAWALESKIELCHIQPGRPMQNGHVESFHEPLSEECLRTHWLKNLFDARAKSTDWRREYNEVRPTAASTTGHSASPCGSVSTRAMARRNVPGLPA